MTLVLVESKKVLNYFMENVVDLIKVYFKKKKFWKSVHNFFFFLNETKTVNARD